MDEKEIRSRMQEVVEVFRTDIGSIRTGRANPGLVEDLEVSVYGGQQELKVNELATISTPDPQTVVIDPFDKSIIGDIRKELLAANVGLNPSIDGEILRISLPPMTTQDRDNYIKLLNTKLENAKIMIRQIRQDYMRDIKDAFEDGELTEDQKFLQEKKLQEITDEFNEKIEDISKQKESELKNI